MKEQEPLEADAVNMWNISPEERLKHDKQFNSLTPVLGYISGEQASQFFLQSGLPPSVLAEIWSLADMGSDGRMDQLEFSIAMKLIKLRLQGRGLPPSLPISMKQPPTAMPNSIMKSSACFGMGSMPNLFVGMPVLTPMPLNPTLTSVPSLVPMTMPLANGNSRLLNPSPFCTTPGLPMSCFSSPMAFSPSAGISKANSLLDLSSSSSNSSSTTSLASNSPKTCSCDWSVPQSTRLKYRQQFNSLDKLMSGYLSGPQVRYALTASNLTQTQLATIWTLADVDKDGQLRAEEFILAMHLVDMVTTGCPLPLTLPSDLVPPCLRDSRPVEMLNGTGPYLSTGLIDGTADLQPAHKNKNNVSYEDRLKENFARGSAELEKRRLALEDKHRREEEMREREATEVQGMREVWEQEQENKRQQEEERRRERKEEAQQEQERQRREWERVRKEELWRMREREQEEITVLRVKKKSLEMELEAVGSRHKQLSDGLRDAQSKRRIQRAEIDLINQRRDGRASKINTLQTQFEDYQRKLCQLVPQQQRLTERLKNMGCNNIPAVAMTSVGGSVAEKGVVCRRLKDQLDTLERETTDKLAMMDHYQQDLKSVDMDDCVLQSLLSLLGCLSQLFLLIKDLRERKGKQQAVLEDLCRVKELKLREMERGREEERERKRRGDEEAARQAKLEGERREEEEEDERRRRIEPQERGGRQHPVLNAERLLTLTSCRALYPFTARNADELSLDADCFIEVDDEMVGEPGWLCGSYRGNRGWFPQSYAERCTTPLASDLLPPSYPTLPPSPGLPDGEVAEAGRIPAPRVTPIKDSSQENNTHTEPPMIHRDVDELESPDPSQLEEFVALFTYESPEAGDLTFSEGDVVMVTEQEGEWWRGCIGNRTGVFPSNYVKPMEPEITRPGAAFKKPEIAQAITLTTEQLSLSPGQLIVVHAKNSSGWWLGELQVRGKGPQRGWFRSSHVKLLPSTSSKTTPAPVPGHRQVQLHSSQLGLDELLQLSADQRYGQ
ncbi:intersectin-2-like isoform X4 [Oncorhynchus keta]|uniref:intersectin-2-like isoform X2 n=1 Tax=Oncorhynchus keta TaxID=8018 RepID=UPI00227A2AB2|nr:intersectin-2-like isoform X2 [Oncorhynchus keta]XP_052327674.1 intersectin-2-like isoform X3 [Oncorhynchus keta]XP_052327675.1 intersectin-2-like isoform X4 [Oncorhynchus keta]